MRPILLILTFAFPAVCLAQQEPVPTATLTVTTRLVAIDAIVRDPANNPLLDLTQGDFTLRVDNQPQPLRYFNRDTDLPLTVGLLIDTSGSQVPYFDDEALAAGLFFRDTLTRPGDRAFVFRFDTQIVPLQELTSRLPDLRNALRRLDYTASSPASLNGTLLYDSIAAASRAFLTADPGRRALIVLTDGNDNGSRSSLSDAIRHAQQAGVAVYAILYTRENPAYIHLPATHPSGIAIMRDLSAATGGRTFVIGPSSPLGQTFAEIEQDLRSQYRLGFTPPPSKPGKFHTVKLQTPDKHLVIQARTGYVAP